MKRMAVIVVVAALVMGSFGSANAIQVKASGMWEFGMGWADNTAFSSAKNGGGNDDIFHAAQIIRTQFDFIASDTLRAMLQFEIGTFVWGAGNDVEDVGGGGLDADGKIIKLKNAYLQWLPAEGLTLRIGVQGAALPSAAFGNPVLDADVAGVIANYAINEHVGITGFWLRPFDRGWGEEAKNLNDEMDLFGLSIPINGEGFTVTPWAMYGRNGNQSGYWDYRSEEAGNDPLSDSLDLKGSGNMWWAGTAIEMKMFDPFALKVDAMYGSAKGGNAPEFSGWLVAALFEYESGAKWGNPGILGWYASGDKSGSYDKGTFGEYGRMPIVGNDNNGFAPALFGYPGCLGETMTDTLLSNSGVGSWGAGLQLDNFTFMESLVHTVRVVYIRGTNDEDMIRNGNSERYGAPFNIMGDFVYMTKKDYAIEADFYTTYEVNENLNIYFETAMIHLNLDPGVWGSNANTTNAWKAQVMLEYTF